MPLDEEVRGDGREPVGRAETLEEADGRRRLGELLKDVPAAEAARHVGITRATLRGELRRLRGILVASGVATNFPEPICGQIP